MDLGIKDISLSVEVGEWIEDLIADHLQAISGKTIVHMPPKSDFDRLVLDLGKFDAKPPFFLEIKVRTRFYEKAISPLRKWQIAEACKDRLKMDSLAFFYFLDRPDYGYKYDLAIPEHTGEITRRDRGTTGEYGFYKPIGRVFMKPFWDKYGKEIEDRLSRPTENI